MQGYGFDRHPTNVTRSAIPSSRAVRAPIADHEHSHVALHVAADEAATPPERW